MADSGIKKIKILKENKLNHLILIKHILKIKNLFI